MSKEFHMRSVFSPFNYQVKGFIFLIYFLAFWHSIIIEVLLHPSNCDIRYVIPVNLCVFITNQNVSHEGSSYTVTLLPSFSHSMSHISLFRSIIANKPWILTLRIMGHNSFLQLRSTLEDTGESWSETVCSLGFSKCSLDLLFLCFLLIRR